MPNITNLTQNQIEKIQIDEGVIYLNYGETDEKLLAPTRGGGEFSATANVRDIEFDGRNGKTAGMQAIEEQSATLKVVSLCMSQEEMALAIPNCAISGTGSKAVLTNPKTGVIPENAYLKNITMFARLFDGTFKKITLYKPMHEGGLTAKAVQKAEGELSFEFSAHYSINALDGELWKIEEISSFKAPQLLKAETISNTKIALTFNNEMASAGLVFGDFSVLMSDGTKAVSAASIATDKKVIELTVATLSQNKTITVSYTKGTATNTDGIALENIELYPVKNNLV